MNQQFQKALIGASGIIGVEVTNQVSNINPDDLSNGASLVVQIILAIATLIGLFKRKKPTV